MAKRYARINFQNRPSVATPLSAEILNILDKGIDDCDNTIEGLTGVINDLQPVVAGKIDKTSIATTDTVNDTSKVLGSNVGYALGQEIDAANLNMIKYKNVIVGDIVIPANATYVADISGFTGVNNVIACLINSTYDYIIGSGHMNADNTVMRVSVNNTYSAAQTVLISAIVLYK